MEKMPSPHTARQELRESWRKKIHSLEQTKLDPFFSTEFIDNTGILSEFSLMINRSLSFLNSQERYMIGLVQPTLAGKTRLLLEISLQRPLILVSFKSDNSAFRKLGHRLYELNPDGRAYSKHYTQRLLINCRMILMVRIFFLAYLDFVDTLVGETKWEQLSVIEKKAIFALVINGDSDHVKSLFLLRLEEFCVDNATDLTNLEEKIRKEHLRISQKLGNPCWGIDECDVPTTMYRGYFFHSDYKVRAQENGEERVLAWQQYESSLELRATPDDYPYKAPTTLFSVIRSLGEEFLKADQLFIFASTFFSCWNTILDQSQYAREKNLIKLFSKGNVLHKNQLLRFIQTKHSHPEIFDGAELELWEGRPGFFFQFLWPSLLSISTADIVQSTIEDSQVSAIKYIQGIVNSIHNHSVQAKKKSLEATLNYFSYRALLHGGRVTDEEWMEHLVSCGLLLKMNETLAALVDPLVRKALLGDREKAISRAEVALLQEMRNSPDKMAKLAIALGVIDRKSMSVADLLTDYWQPLKIAKHLKKFYLCSDFAASIDDLHPLTHPFATDSPIWKDHIIFPKNGLHLPDVSFIAKDENNESIVLVSLQMKLLETKLADKSKDKKKTFLHAVKSTTRPYFSKLVQKDWKLLESKKIFHLRIVVCWGGFLTKHVAMARAHNEQHPDQPIFLIAPCGLVGNAVFLKSIYQFLKSAKHQPKMHASSESFEMEELTPLFAKLNAHEQWELESVEEDSDQEDEDDDEEGEEVEEDKEDKEDEEED